MNGKQFVENGSSRSLSLRSVLPVIGGGRRLEILRYLADGPKDVTAIAENLELSLSIISHNLGILRRYALVVGESLGKQKMYRLTERVEASLCENAVRLRVSGANGDFVLVHSGGNHLD